MPKINLCENIFKEKRLVVSIMMILDSSYRNKREGIGTKVKKKTTAYVRGRCAVTVPVYLKFCNQFKPKCGARDLCSLKMHESVESN